MRETPSYVVNDLNLRYGAIDEMARGDVIAYTDSRANAVTISAEVLRDKFWLFEVLDPATSRIRFISDMEPKALPAREGYFCLSADQYLRLMAGEFDDD